MPRNVHVGLIQAATPYEAGWSIAKTQKAALDAHIPLIEEAGKKGVQILGLQEIFNGPYFCPSQDKFWYDATEAIPGPTTEMMQAYAKKYQMAMVVPLYEREQAGVYYNSAAVIDADGSYLGKYRKHHIPHTNQFWEKFFFRPGNMGFPVFRRATARSASTSATTATSRRARVRSASTAPRSCSTRPPPSQGSRSTSGSWSSPHTPSRTDTSSPRRTASAPKRRGTSASSTARATS